MNNINLENHRKLFELKRDLILGEIKNELKSEIIKAIPINSELLSDAIYGAIVTGYLLARKELKNEC